MNEPCNNPGCITSGLHRSLDAPRRAVANMLSPFARRPAVLIGDCGRALKTCVCKSCGDVRPIQQTCQKFGCPVCDTIYGLKLAAKLKSGLRADADFIFLSVTWPNVPLPLGVNSLDSVIRSALVGLTSAFAALRRSMLFSRAAVGGIWCIEFAFSQDAYSPSKISLRPHIHAIVESTFVGITQLQELWFRLSGAKSCHVMAASDPAGLGHYLKKRVAWESLAAELAPAVPVGAVLAAMQRVLARKRRYGTFGSWHARTIAAPTDHPRTPREGKRCRECHGQNFAFEYRRPPREVAKSNPATGNTSTGEFHG